jgi:Lysyl oxidase
LVRTRERTVSLGIAIALVLLLTAFVVQALRPGPVMAASDQLPNLRMLPLDDWRIQNVNGRRLLRFTTIMANAGPGHFEVRGRRPDTATKTMTIRQVIFDSAGGSRAVHTGAIGRYAGDGHDHWHVQRIMTYELYKVDNPATVRGGAKAGFCFLDTTAWRLSLPHARQNPYYQESWCGTRQALSNRIGISVGWGDRYPWDFAFQWIDITGLPSGRYVVRSTVDIGDWYRETKDYDNCKWARIRIPATGTRVTVLETGTDCGRDAITPAETFAGATTWDPARDIAFQPSTYVGYTFNRLGTVLRSKRVTLDEATTAQAARRARIPGQDGRWFYVTSGTWDGYWIRDTAKVELQPPA